MTHLNLSDIQGNIHRPYGRYGFPHTRHLFFNIANAAAGRRFVQGLRPRITTAEPWDSSEDDSGKHIVAKPAITLNIGFTYAGLRALDLPTTTLRMLPDEFIDGMHCRAEILGDQGGSAPEHWDQVWRQAPEDRARQVHVWVSLNSAMDDDGSPVAAMAEWTEWIRGLAAATANQVTLLAGHGADGSGLWQDSSAMMTKRPDGKGMMPLPTEHFGFVDGISDPAFRGQFDSPEAEARGAMGGGKFAKGRFDPEHSWSALETGEFILGHVDEGQELPVATSPAEFARNGTFMAWRKLKQNVEAFEADMERQTKIWMRVQGETDAHAAGETVRAKMVGRWRNGTPLSVAPTWAALQDMQAEYDACMEIAIRKPRNPAEAERLEKFSVMRTNFRFGDDADGAKCPLGAHIRRANPRDMLDPKLSPTEGATTLTNRRRIIRRGLPYVDPNGERGVIFMAVCASLFRQFEFIQQQWMNYGLDFDAGNDTCPLVGSRTQSVKHVVPPGPTNAEPFIAANLPEFVATRGGDYFFIPSISALRMIAMGMVDPT